MLPRLNRCRLAVSIVSLIVLTQLLLWQDGTEDILQDSNQWQRNEQIVLEQFNASSPNSSIELVKVTSASDDLKILFNTRNTQIKDVCLNEQILDLNINSSIINAKEFVINSEYNLIWCSIFKSASTTWFHNFLKLKGYTEKDVKKSKKTPVEFVRKMAYPRPSVEQLAETVNSGHFTSFIIVRHPFERLLSSYRDKIETNSEHFYDIVRCEMAGTPILKKRQKCFPTFSQFVDFVIRQADTGEHLDEHWQTYDNFCSPCQFNFSYVLHFENLHAEEEYLFNQASSSWVSVQLNPDRECSSTHND